MPDSKFPMDSFTGLLQECYEVHCIISHLSGMKMELNKVK